MRRRYEILLVLALSLIVGVISLWRVFLHPGFIYHRDSYPAYYISSRQLAVSYLGFPFIMDNVFMPIVVLLYFNLLSPMVTDWVSYFIFPFSLAVPSMYFSSRYFLDRFTTAKESVKVISSIIVSFFYAVSPTAYYFSHWSNYAAFYALVPALIAGTFYSIEKGGIKGAFLLSLFASLTTTDPRGFVFTLFIIITVLLYKRKGLRTFLLSIPFYVLINSRLFVDLYQNFHSYSSISLSISNEQLWLNYYTFNLLDTLRGLSLFRPLVSYLSIGNPLLIYVFSFAFVEAGLIGYLFLDKKSGRGVATYFLLLYLFLVVFVSSNVNVLSLNLPIAVSYPIWGFLAQTQLYSYLWLFLPTYISEMILAPLYLLVSLVIAKVLERYYFIPLIVLLCVAQFSFSAYFVISGNYAGQYTPVTPPTSAVDVGKFLETHDIGNVFVNVSTPYSSFFSLLPNVTTNVPFYNSSDIGVLLNEYGVQYVITTANNSYVENIISSHQDVFKLVYNSSGILVYENRNFTYHIISPVYIYFSKTIPPTSNAVNVIPSYEMFYIPPKYVGGYIGNITYPELLALSAYKQGVNPIKLEVKHLSSYTNFTDTINVNVYDSEILNEFPGISFIGVAEPSTLSLNVSPGLYKVVMVYVSVPGGGVFGVSNGSYSLSVSTSSPKVSVIFYYLGKIYVGDEAKLFFNGHQSSYLVALMFIPNWTKVLSNFSGVAISSYPSPFGRSLGEAYVPSPILPVLLNIVTLPIAIAVYVFRQKFVILARMVKSLKPVYKK